MPSLKARLAPVPDGAEVLFFIQIFATLGFAVLNSTLVLYATKHLRFAAKDATAQGQQNGALAEEPSVDEAAA